jgi:hypothetical protein
MDSSHTLLFLCRQNILKEALTRQLLSACSEMNDSWILKQMFRRSGGFSLFNAMVTHLWVSVSVLGIVQGAAKLRSPIGPVSKVGILTSYHSELL